jgi:hypothetical protein
LLSAVCLADEMMPATEPATEPDWTQYDFNAPSNPSVPVTITVKEAKLEELRNDLLGFGQKAEETTRAEREALAQALADSFKTTQAKMIINFGKTVQPIIQARADILELTVVDKKCDVDCGAKCYTPDYEMNKISFNETCMKECHCTFKFEKADQETIEKKINKLKKVNGKAAQELDARLNEFVGGFQQ